ncbi:MAG: hypothetical protein WCI30_01095 [Clostridia bacterium]
MDKQTMLENLFYLADSEAKCRQLVIWQKERQLQLAALLLDLTKLEDDYFLQSKAYKLLEQLASTTELIALQERLPELAEEYILRSMNILSTQGDEKCLTLLATYFFHTNPYLVRGAVVACGRIGGAEAFLLLWNFTISVKGRVVRLEILEEALAIALSKVEIVIEREGIIAKSLCSGDGRRLWSELDLVMPVRARFSVYPTNDYFTLLCQKKKLQYAKYRWLMQLE